MAFGLEYAKEWYRYKSTVPKMGFLAIQKSEMFSKKHIYWNIGLTYKQWNLYQETKRDEILFRTECN